MDGMINIYKEKGYTSHDVVAKLRGILKMKKIGHTGTLDPEAEGVLPVCLGKGTKLCDLLADRTKTYQAVMKLGVSTDTEDLTGTIIKECPVLVTEQEIREAVLSFQGEYEQIPPMYSALKVNGRKLYELAREGRTVERKPRHVQILEIAVERVELPFVTMTITCSKGTYIRSLCRDIGEKLGCLGAMAELTRTRVGEFMLKEAISLAKVEQLVRDGRIEEWVHPVDEAFSAYPQLVVPPKWNKAVDNGNSFFWRSEEWKPGLVRIYKENGMFVGLYQYDTQAEQMKPYKLFFVEGR